MATKDKKPAVSAATAALALAAGEAGTATQVVVAPVNHALPAGLKLKRLVTVPSVAIKEPGDMRVFRIDSEIRVSKVVDKSDQKREPAMICDVTEHETGQVFIFIVPAVVRENLIRDYAPAKEGDTPLYVGKTFLIQNRGKRSASQRYNDFGIAEVEAE